MNKKYSQIVLPTRTESISTPSITCDELKKALDLSESVFFDRSKRLLLPLRCNALQMAKVCCLNIYEVNLIFKSYLLLWRNQMNINYVPLKKYLNLFTKDQQGLIKTFFENTEISFEDYFLCTCLYIFFDIHHLLLLLLPMCRIYSNICITQNQVDDFFKQLNLQAGLYSDIEKVLEKSLLSLPGCPYGAFSIKSFTNYFKGSIAFQTLLYQLRIILSDRALTPRIYKNIVQRMKYQYYLAEERFLGSNKSNNNNKDNRIPKPFNSNAITPIVTPTPSPPSSPLPDTTITATTDNNNCNINTNISSSSSLPPTLPLSPTLSMPPMITVIQVANNNNSNNNNNMNLNRSVTTNNDNNNNDNTSIITATTAIQTTTTDAYYHFPHSSPSSLRNSCDFNDVNSSVSNNNGSRIRKEVLPPTESVCQKITRVLFSIEPPPNHADFLLERDVFINGLDNMIYILKKQYGYSTRCNSIRDVITSGRQKSLNFTRNMMISMSNRKGSSSLPSSPHVVKHTSLGYHNPNLKIQPLPEIAEN